MGQSPIPHYYYNRVAREESSCGTHNLCEHVFPDKLTPSVACRIGKLCVSINRVRKSQGPMVTMGQGPIPHYYYNRVVREGSSFGTHILCEHAPSGKMVVGVACGAGKFCVPNIRVCSPQERVQN